MVLVKTSFKDCSLCGQNQDSISFSLIMSKAKLQQFFEAIEILLHPCIGKNIGILQKEICENRIL